VSEVTDTSARSEDGAPTHALRSVARGGTLNLVGFVVSGVLGFVLAIVITRELGARGAGIFFSAVAVFTILANITELGADTGVVRFVARAREQGRARDLRRLIAVALVPSAIAGVLAGIAMVVFAQPLSELFARSDPAEVTRFLRLLGPFLPLTTIATVAMAATRGFGSMRPFVAIESVGKPFLKPFLLLVLGVGGLSAAEVALGWGIPEALACAAALVVLVRMLGAVERGTPTRGVREVAREFWTFSAPRGIAAAFQITIIWFDLLLLGHFRPLAEVGVYAAASRVITVGTFALQSIRLAIAPQISRLLAREDRAGAQVVYQTATWWLMVVSWPMFLLLAVFAPYLLQIFGLGFASGQTALLILSLAMLVNLGTGNVTVVLLMGGKSSWNLMNTAVALVLNVGLNLVLIPRYGMEGAALAWAVSIIVDNLMALTEVWAFLGMRPFGSGYAVAALAPVVCVGVTAIAARLALGANTAGFVVALAVAVPLYAASIWRFRRTLRLDEFLRSLRTEGASASRSTPGAA